MKSGVWKFIAQCLHDDFPVVLLLVLQSKGSSPGRKGFKMAVSADRLVGSVGGGMMEHKFVELAREQIRSGVSNAVLKQQFHSKTTPVNQSGMICSGESTLLVYPVSKKDQSAITRIIQSTEKNEPVFIRIDPSGIRIDNNSEDNSPDCIIPETNHWQYTETIGVVNRIHIIGGGHVSLAFSKLMAELKFQVFVYDDREGLNTLELNTYAYEKCIVDYSVIGEIISSDPTAYAVIMTFGYRSDGVVLRQLLNNQYKYLGLLGSKAKIEQMWKELGAEGIESDKLNSVHAPVGLHIFSQTPEEIAVSIAAEIIMLKNKRP